MWSHNIFLLLFVMSFRLRSTVANNDWTYLRFSQSWPATVCRVWKEKNSTNTCIFPEIENAWSIHGIWPSVPRSEGPEFCNNSWPFDLDEVKSVQKGLEQGWINVEVGTPPDDLWAHEWNKHGTCAASIELLDSQLKYFSQGLKWLELYSMRAILLEANILPTDTNTYSQDVFYKAVKNKLGVDIDMNCLHDYYDGKQYLWELRICFSKAFELIDCNNSYVRKFFIDQVGFVSNCDPDGIIYSTA